MLVGIIQLVNQLLRLTHLEHDKVCAMPYDKT